MLCWHTATHDPNVQSDLAVVQLKARLHSFVMAYNFAKRLKTLKGLTPYEYICKI